MNKLKFNPLTRELDRVLSSEEIKTRYESNPDTNAFTDSDSTKLTSLSPTPFVSDPCVRVTSTGEELVEIESIDELEDLNLTLTFNVSNSSEFSTNSALLATRIGATDQNVGSFTGLSDGFNTRQISLSETDINGLRSGTGAILFALVVGSERYALGCISINPINKILSYTNNSFTLHSAEDRNDLPIPTGTLAYEDINNSYIRLSGNSTISLDTTNIPVNIIFEIVGDNVSFAAVNPVSITGVELPRDGDLLMLKNSANNTFTLTVIGNLYTRDDNRIFLNDNWFILNSLSTLAQLLSNTIDIRLSGNYRNTGPISFNCDINGNVIPIRFKGGTTYSNIIQLTSPSDTSVYTIELDPSFTTIVSNSILNMYLRSGTLISSPVLYEFSIGSIS